MRYLLNNEGRVIGSTKDNLHSTAVSGYIPENANIYDYIYEEGGFVYSPLNEQTPDIINIEISGVSPTLTGFDNKPNEYTVNELTEITATGSGLNALVAMGLTKFRVPFVRTDTQRKAYMVATIEQDGTFSISITFKTGGKWIVNTELLNSELTPEELAQFSFSIDEHVFKVI
ncbi:hypothetical protein Q4489_04435 [Thalassotalea sp. 1_MG-2023]|uniref:hypothetical protein n=1 Tax=Thalassotalea sp. 1_MG-2023 TaxID=3062680 RepID=UPI0026E4365B|nr:hypothetical protein [Thalassotalea sp. 1_MG-2023]MDO6426245.1 hypothetical protein [Thalassotalea sp. 1_MG-2023]